jgi:hypothetical protein
MNQNTILPTLNKTNASKHFITIKNINIIVTLLKFFLVKFMVLSNFIGLY